MKYKREITARDHPKYSGVLEKVYNYDTTDPNGNWRTVFFIHGYNVDENDARISFDNMIRKLRRKNIPPEIINSIWKFYWSGSLKNKALSTISFSKQIPNAVESAKVFTEYLNELRGPSNTPMQIILVAHSLGCRLLVETIVNHVKGKNNIYKVLLMAAAVPVFLIDKKIYKTPLQQDVDLRYNMFSKKDWIVSKLIFGSGSSLAGEGFFPKAVGGTGKPESMWTENHSTNLKHSQYWNSTQVVNMLRKMLNFTVPRELIKRYLEKREFHIN